MIVMNMAATYTTLTATFWLTRLAMLPFPRQEARHQGDPPPPGATGAPPWIRTQPAVLPYSAAPSGQCRDGRPFFRPAVRCRPDHSPVRVSALRPAEFHRSPGRTGVCSICTACRSSGFRPSSARIVGAISVVSHRSADRLAVPAGRARRPGWARCDPAGRPRRARRSWPCRRCRRRRARDAEDVGVPGVTLGRRSSAASRSPAYTLVSPDAATVMGLPLTSLPAAVWESR